MSVPGSRQDPLLEPVAVAGAAAALQPGTVAKYLQKARPPQFALVLTCGVLVAVFAIWVPDTFLTVSTLQFLLNQNAVTALFALAVMLPLAAGVFDLSVGSAMGLGGALSGILVADSGASATEAIIAIIGLGLLLGIVNSVIVLFCRIDSFIATLASGSIMTAVTIAITGDSQIVGQIPSVLGPVINASTLGLAVPVAVAALAAVFLWYVLQHTPLGRSIYATGFNEQASRLAGIRTRDLRIGAFMWSATGACVAGLLVTGRTGSVDASLGPQYLLPAFAAVFLGTVQHAWGRFNALGTVLAVCLLGIASEGLSLTSAPVWTPDIFSGAALILSLGISQLREAKKP